MVIIIALTVAAQLKHRIKLKSIKVSVKIMIIVIWKCLKKVKNYEKSIKLPFVIYADIDIELLLEKRDACHYSPGKSSTVIVKKHTACSYWLFFNYTLLNW